MVNKDPEKRKIYHRQWTAKRREAFFADKQCQQCGSTYKLQLWYPNQQDKTTHNFWTWSAERQAQELAKCQILCWQCFWRERNARHDYRLHHGTVTGYRRYACRCGECMAVKNTYQNAHRARFREQRTCAIYHQNLWFVPGHEMLYCDDCHWLHGEWRKRPLSDFPEAIPFSTTQHQ